MRARVLDRTPRRNRAEHATNDAIAQVRDAMMDIIASHRTDLRAVHMDIVSLQAQARAESAGALLRAGAFRRRSAAEIKVTRRPTGRGSMKVYAMLTMGFW